MFSTRLHPLFRASVPVCVLHGDHYEYNDSEYYQASCTFPTPDLRTLSCLGSTLLHLVHISLISHIFHISSHFSTFLHISHISHISSHFFTCLTFPHVPTCFQLELELRVRHLAGPSVPDGGPPYADSAHTRYASTSSTKGKAFASAYLSALVEVAALCNPLPSSLPYSHLSPPQGGHADVASPLDGPNDPSLGPRGEGGGAEDREEGQGGGAGGAGGLMLHADIRTCSSDEGDEVILHVIGPSSGALACDWSAVR
jgi:hypothetical protein